MFKNYKKYIFIAVGIMGFILSFVFYYNKVVQPQTDREELVGEKVNVDITEDQIYSNIVAFAKLYGYVRYFHPSDEVASLSTREWNQFAIYGVSKVKQSASEEELKETLEELFVPIAPTIQLYMDNQTPEQPAEYKDGSEVIAWQHYGLGTIEGGESLYKSQRTIAIVKDNGYEVENNRLFEEFPTINETINEKISPNIYTSVPLVLYKNESGTVGSSEESKAKLKNLKENFINLDMTSKNEDVRYAGIIITWNTLNHFYPYFHVTDSNWEKQLLPALKDVGDNGNRNDYVRSVMRLFEKTGDGHAFHTLDTFNLFDPKYPFMVEMVEDKLIITVASEESELLPGDVILSINNQDTTNYLEELREIIPGSPHFKDIILGQMIRHEERADLQIEREGRIFEVTIKPSINSSQLDLFNRNNEESFKEIEDEIYYIDFFRFDELENQMETLLNAKGVIFDLRDFRWDVQKAADMEEIIARLTNKPVQSPIARVMKTIYPDQKEVTFDELPRYSLQPKDPKFKGRVVFLTFAGNMSNQEFLLGQIKDNQLATIIGQPTAGADGNVQVFDIPGNLTGVFTGMEILNNDRTQTHMVGIQPDILVERTLEGIQNGEDEYITRALEYILEEN